VINLGRRADNHIVIDDPHVSRQHAQLRVIDNRYVIFDLESAGGTFVNNSRVEQATLFPGDVISLAGAELVYGQDAGIISGDGEGSTRQLLPVQDKYE
jgi:pSer/pThr/pTyr-binding forkhead associated (FHA) protein